MSDGARPTPTVESIGFEARLPVPPPPPIKPARQTIPELPTEQPPAHETPAAAVHPAVEVAPPTRQELARITTDPQFAQEALRRWGKERLLDPTGAEQQDSARRHKHHHDHDTATPEQQRRSRLFRTDPDCGCQSGEKIPYPELDPEMQAFVDERDLDWPGRPAPEAQPGPFERPMEVVRDGHLGGYVAGGDPATQYPTLWTWLIREWGVETMLDLGCGDGTTMQFFADNGCVAWGVDGIVQTNEAILAWDFTAGSLASYKTTDLVWCAEFVEHIEERFVQNFVEVLASGRTVLMTHATPGQPGHHHVNCQPAEYWRGVMAAQGFVLDERLTVATRVLAALDGNAWSHYVRSGLAFVRPEDLRDESGWRGWDWSIATTL